MKTDKINIIIRILFGIIILISAYFALQIRFEYDFEAFFPHDNIHLDFYDTYRDRFEPDDHFLLIGIESESGTIFDITFLNRVDSFTQTAALLPLVDRSLSITNLKRPVYAAGQYYPLDYIHPDDPQRLEKDSMMIMQDPKLTGRFVGEDARSLTVILNTTHVLDLKESQKLSSAIDSLVAVFEWKHAHIAGRPYYQALFVKRAKKEFSIFTILSSFITLIFLIFLFRRFWGVSIALISVLLGMFLFMGYLGYFEVGLDPMSILFPILMITVGMSDVLHLMSKYVDELRKGFSKRKALRITIREIGLATFLTSTTTALGFASLFTSNIPPIRSFGMHAAVGVFLAYITAILFTTSFLGFFNADSLIRRKHKKNTWHRYMQWMYLMTRFRPRTIAITGFVALLLSLTGISLISTDVHIENNFPRKADVRKDFRFFENKYGGVRNYELAIMTGSGYSLLDTAVIRELDSLENFLNRQNAISSIISPLTAFKTFHQAYYADNPDYYTIPSDGSLLLDLKKQMEEMPSEILDVSSDKDRQFGRLSAKIHDIGSDSAQIFRSFVEDWIGQHIDSSVVTFRHTGTSLLFDKNSDYVRESLFAGLGMAFIVVSILMALLFKNFKMVVISLIPNLFPLLICGAIIGFSGIELDAPTSIIFAIAFGIAVDDTIHFLSKFNIEINKGKTNAEAIRTTFLETGKAIGFTTLILFSGFFILIFSQYPPTFNIGLLVSLTLVSALIADLFLIPVLIYWILGIHNRLEVRSFIRIKLLGWNDHEQNPGSGD